MVSQHSIFFQITALLPLPLHLFLIKQNSQKIQNTWLLEYY